MKKIMSAVLGIILTFSMFTLSVSAADDVNYSADALHDYPDNYSEIYGVTFNVTQTAGFYLAGIYVDNGKVTEVVGGSVATFAPTAMKDYAASFGAAVTTKDLTDGVASTLTYLSDKPLFTSKTTLAKARLYAPAASPLTVNGYTWLGKDGKTFVPAKDTTTGDHSNYGYVLLLISGAGILIAARKMKPASC